MATEILNNLYMESVGKHSFEFKEAAKGVTTTLAALSDLIDVRDVDFLGVSLMNTGSVALTAFQLRAKTSVGSTVTAYKTTWTNTLQTLAGGANAVEFVDVRGLGWVQFWGSVGATTTTVDIHGICLKT